MYALYFNRSQKSIKVTKPPKSLQTLNYTDEVVQYNNCYFLCAKRKPLVEKAKEMKQKWILELEQELNLIKEIKI